MQLCIFVNHSGKKQLRFYHSKIMAINLIINFLYFFDIICLYYLISIIILNYSKNIEEFIINYFHLFYFIYLFIVNLVCVN